MIRTRGRKALWILSILLGVLPAGAATFVDMVGRQVELQQPPRRIISLAPSLTEIIFALGAGDSVVGVTDYSDYPREAEGKPTVGGGVDPNMEVIVGLQPDLVLASADTNRWDTLVRLERLKIPVFGVKPIGVEGVLASIARVGEVLGRPPQAEKLITEMRRRMAAVSERVSTLPRPTILYVVWIDPLIVAGRETVIDDLIRIAGGANIVQAPGFPHYGLEQVVIDPPDLIVLAFDRGGLQDGEILRRLPVWREIRTVRDGAVRVIDAGMMNRPGPRIAEAVEVLARVFHEEAFSGRRP
jgi:iron complex transport system substrate-binding protein